MRYYLSHRQFAQLPSQPAIGAGGQGFKSRVGQIGQRLATAATFLRSCVAQALSRGDGLRNSLHVSA